ncbi:MAG TPA: DUF2339 domain-containing protein [Pyrinomonadaceae bacterium]|nr:DUF2339 domain-containing protein [Pyrinomonadaceae bacterium]
MAEDTRSTEEKLDNIMERLVYLERVLQMHTERLSSVEQRLGHNFQTPPQQPPPQAGQTPPQPTPYQPNQTTTYYEPPSQTPPPPQSRAAAWRRKDVETLVGGSWFNWIGILAITFGVAFFLKYTFESELIGRTGRVTLGALGGLALLGAGEWLRRRGRMRQYAHVLSGGGVLILYLSVYAAREFYGLIEQQPAFLLMTLVTAAAVLLAARNDALPIAVLGLIGGFLTPVLLATGEDNQPALFTYIALLDAGVLALAYFKGWRSLNFMAFGASVLVFLGWGLAYYATPKLWLTIFFLTVFFLLFSLLAILHNVLAQRPARWFDILLITLNATFYFGACYLLLKDAGYLLGLGSLAVSVTAFYLLLFFIVWSRHRADRLLVYSYLGAAITFLTMAVGIQLRQQWVTMGWAMEGLMLTWVGLRARQTAPRHAALVVFVIAVLHWLGSDVPDFAFRAGDGFVPLLNRRALSCAVLVATLIGSAWLYRREGEAVVERERAGLNAFFVLTANLLAIALLTFDASDYFARSRASVTPDRTAELRRLDDARQFSLSIIWAVYGGAMLAYGRLQASRSLRLTALVLLAVTTLKVFFWDLESLERVYRIISFIVLGAILLAVSYLYQRSQQQQQPTREPDVR